MKSTLTDERFSGYCVFCGKPCNTEHHLIFGRGIRQLAEEDGLKVTACNECHVTGKKETRIHDNPMAEKLSKMLGQMAYERDRCADGMSKSDARELFRMRYGRSFL